MIYEPNQCPIRFGLGAFGDRWSLLIIRDMMFRGFCRFQDLLESGEGISTNVLSDRLRRLEAQQLISRKKDPANGRRVVYELTGKGEDLLPVMLAIFAWAEKHDPQTHVSGELAKRIRDESGAHSDEMSHIRHLITERLSGR
ncbi:MAG: helix-turn-helix transcriptional regulator [Gammaproteobacteria bacterium]|nr:helix-turn-helix transcriptional regulator [Gammaproteobacteria bacterium]